MRGFHFSKGRKSYQPIKLQMELLPYVAVFLFSAAIATFLISFWERSEKRRQINAKLEQAKNKAAAEDKQTIVNAINELSANLESLEEKVDSGLHQGHKVREQVDSLAESLRILLIGLGKEIVEVPAKKELVSVEPLEDFKKKGK